MDTNDTLIAYGGAIKALGDGKVGGYLIRYTGAGQPDLTGDYFTPDTDYDFEDGHKVSVYYHHGQDRKLRNRKLGKGTVRRDDVGVWIEAQLDLRDEYEQAVYQMAEENKVGWSSGAVAHLVTREQTGESWHIKSWPIGEASITPTPAAGPQLTQVIPLKSLALPKAEAEAAQDTAPQATETSEGSATDNQTETKEIDMSEEVEKTDTAPAIDGAAILDALKGISARLETLEQTPVNAVPAAKAIPQLKHPRGDSFAGSFKNWTVNGTDDGLKSMMGHENGMERISIPGRMYTPPRWDRQTKSWVKASNDTDMNIGTAGDGGNLVPTGFFNEIIARRDENALTSRLPLRNIPGVGTTVNVPLDGEADGEFITKGEATAFDRDAPTIGTVAMTLVKYTKTIQVSDELMQDTPTNLMAFLSEWVGRGMAKTDNNLLLTEVASDGTAFKTYASATAIAFGELEDILGNVDLSSYLDDDNAAAWVMRSSTHWDIKSIVGSDRQYAQNDSGGMQLLGYPVAYSAKAAATAASAKDVYFGNWRYVGVRYGPGLTFLRNPYLLANSGQLALHYYYRVDFEVLQAEAIGYAVHPSA